MKKTIIISLILMQSVILQAQHVFKSLNDVWEYSLSKNPENTIYRLKIEQAKQDKKTANSYLFPKAAAGFMGQKNIEIPETPVPGELVGKPGQTVYLKFGENYSYNSGITVSKTLLDWQSKFQAKIAKLNVSLTEAQRDFYEQTLKEQIAQVYYASLLAFEALRITSKDKEIADSLFLIAKDRSDQGLIDGMVLNQAKINKNKIFEKYLQSEQYQKQCLYNLKLFLGLTATDSLVLTENVSVENNLQFISDPVSNDKYIQLNSLQADISKVETKRALAKFAPKIDIVGYYGVQQYQNDFNLSFSSSDWKQNRYLGLSLSVPIFTGFANQSQYKSAKISRNMSEKRLEDETRKSAINDSILLSNYFSSVKLSEINTETFKVSENSVGLAAQKYAEGLISLDEYLKVFDDYLTVETQYFNSLSEYLINKATIEARKNQ